MMSMPVKVIFANNSLRNYQYLIYGDKTVCLDPFSSQQIFNELKKDKKTVDILINTHHHYDHIRGNKDILQKENCLYQKDFLEIDLGHKARLIKVETPGHTMDSVCFLLEYDNQKEALFTGDSLFIGGVGHCRDGDVKALGESLLLFNGICEPQTKLYIGHDYWESNKKFAQTYYKADQALMKAIKKRDEKQTTWSLWEDEKEHNVFLKVLYDDTFRDTFFSSMKPIEAFCQMRALKDQF